MRGRFISFEGPEGSGKTTHAAALAAWLRERGVDVLTVREPGGTRTGEAIRDILQHDQAGEPVVEEAETLLFAASRAQLVRLQIAPALAAGRWVVCDRFADSTAAYQGYGRGLNRAHVASINAFAVGRTWPDLTLLLDLPVEAGFRRVQRRNARSGARRDRMERESLRFHARVREGYGALARRSKGRIRVIDARRPVAAVARDVRAAVEPLLGRRAARGTP